MFNVIKVVNNQDIFVSKKPAKHPNFFFYNFTSHIMTEKLTILSEMGIFWL